MDLVPGCGSTLTPGDDGPSEAVGGAAAGGLLGAAAGGLLGAVRRTAV
jgi:hypothetical protein